MTSKHFNILKVYSSITLVLLFFINGTLSSQELLSGCESIAYDSVHSRYLVSSLLNQQIVAIDKQGNQNLFKEGIPSFGNCITDSMLYVAGGTRVRGLDLETGEVVMNVNFPGSVQLDGVTVDKRGYLYVVGTRTDKIFKLNLADQTQTILVDGGLATAPQDIIYDDTRNRLLVCHFQQNAPIIAVDPDSGEMDTVAVLGPGFSDGITVDGEGNVYVGSYDDGGKIYMYDGEFNEPPAMIAMDMGEPAGIDVNRIDNVLAVPSFAGSSVSFIQLPAVYLNAEISTGVTTGHAPLTVHFTDLSSASPEIKSWKWDFDNDGVTDSEEQNPEWTYYDAGHYSLRLTMESDSLIKEVLFEEYIHVFNGESAVQFDGGGGFIQVDPSETLSMGNEWTWEGWIKPLSLHGKSILDNGAVNLYTNKNSSLSYRKNSLAVKLILEDESQIRFSSSDSSLTLDTWNHFAVSYNYSAGHFKVYINGDEELLTLPDSVILQQPLKAVINSPFIIGNNSMLNRGFMGCIDEVRVWNRARTEEEIRINMEEYLTGNENNLTAYWKMNEGSGLEILDLTNNDNSGVLTECHYSDGIDFSIFSSVEEYDEVSAEVPGDYRLDQNYPNPFNPATTIEFLLPAGTNVHLAVYSISGELVATLADREFGAGSYRVVWNGRNKIGNDVASGIYFYRIMTESFSAVKKMMLVR